MVKCSQPGERRVTVARDVGTRSDLRYSATRMEMRQKSNIGSSPMDSNRLWVTAHGISVPARPVSTVHMLQVSPRLKVKGECTTADI